ncbi:hypothetical protein HD599_001577 [Conyzicola lurida]|uniref:Lipocalin-like domain-containing protein n=1 Tax=Conyzicola lurida TaxID=1172621 RepID=A0A841ALL4_9MICO|nr:hypothetical protein [Conyzicola lurida]MBB5843254.1 hypothetical protein [Conyzicola lurida]
MLSRPVVALLLASTALLAIAGCTTGAPDTDSTPVVTTPQADISGEWVVTRTVVSSTDVTDPLHAVGATSVRYVSVVRDDCETALCPGTVSSGAAMEAREQTDLIQTDGGFGYEFVGTLDCMNTATGGVLVVDGFEYEQTTTFTAVAPDGGTATTLTGELVYTDTVTPDAVSKGCTRDPSTITVEYSLAAVRAP